MKILTAEVAIFAIGKAAYPRAAASCKLLRRESSSDPLGKPLNPSHV